MEIILELPEATLYSLQNRVFKAGQRAKKSGLPIPVMAVESIMEREHYVHDALAHLSGNTSTTRRVVSRLARVKLSNFSPQVGDYSFVGSRYFRIGKDGRLVTSAIGTVPEDIASREKLCCDHCGYNRNRSMSWVLQNNSSGNQYEIGSTCIEAFTGYDLGRKFHEGLQEVGRVLHSIQRVGNTSHEEDENVLEEEVRVVLAVALRHLDDNDFISSSDARLANQRPSWAYVMDDLIKYRRDDLSENDILVTEADFNAADKVVEHVATNLTTNFNRTVMSAITRKYATMHDVALLTAAAKSFLRKLERDQSAANIRSLVSDSVYLGEKGERLEFVGKVYSIKEFIGRYGVSSYITIIDADNNLLHWKASGSAKLKSDMAYSLRGTIKEHRACSGGVFEGVPETVITRVSVEQELGPTSFEPRHETLVISPEDEEALDSLLAVVNF